MTVFDQLFFVVYTYYKTKFKRRANKIAVLYISIFQVSLVLLLGSFFAAFFKQMHIQMLTSSNGWLLFVMTSIFIYFKNWISYSGKHRMIINAKMSKKKKQKHNIVLLWVLPMASITLALILLRSFL